MTLPVKHLRFVEPTDPDPAVAPEPARVPVRLNLGDIDSRVAAHGSNQLEIKLGYRVDARSREPQRYKVDVYFFVPKPLGINPHTYGREQFYRDMHAYIRLKTPRMDLQTLVDGTNSASPYHCLSGLMDRTTRGRRWQRQVNRQLRLIGCITHVNLQRRTNEVLAALGRSDLRGNQAVAALLEDATRVLDTYRRLAMADGEFAEAYGYVNEYLSTTVQTELTRLYEGMSVHHDVTVLGLRSQVAAMLVTEQARYAAPRLRSEVSEQFLHHRGLLKKFVMSALYLEANKERNDGHVQLMAALAAGIAMLFAATAAIVTQRWYALNSLPFIMALVGSYILKDRIKDWIKHYAAATLTRWIWDYNVRIVDPATLRPVGRSREGFRYLRQSHVPVPVRRRRYAHAQNSLDTDPRRESIIHYEKAIRLRGRAMPRLHDAPLVQVNEIIRFNLNSFLHRADTPSRPVRWLDPISKCLETLTCPKVYHLNIILTFRIPGRGVQLQRVRVILDRSGIRRLEAV